MLHRFGTTSLIALFCLCAVVESKENVVGIGRINFTTPAPGHSTLGSSEVITLRNPRGPWKVSGTYRINFPGPERHTSGFLWSGEIMRNGIATGAKIEKTLLGFIGNASYTDLHYPCTADKLLNFGLDSLNHENENQTFGIAANFTSTKMAQVTGYLEVQLDLTPVTELQDGATHPLEDFMYYNLPLDKIATDTSEFSLSGVITCKRPLDELFYHLGVATGNTCTDSLFGEDSYKIELPSDKSISFSFDRSVLDNNIWWFHAPKIAVTSEHKCTISVHTSPYSYPRKRWVIYSIVGVATCGGLILAIIAYRWFKGTRTAEQLPLLY